MIEGRRNSLTAGLVLVGLGAAALLAAAGVRINGHSPWAIFGLLVPAVAVVGYLAMGAGKPSHRRAGIWMLAPLATAVFFIFNLPWDALWPAFMIIFGLGVLLGR